MHENLRTTARDYETLLESLISIFQSIKEVEYHFAYFSGEFFRIIISILPNLQKLKFVFQQEK